MAEAEAAEARKEEEELRRAFPARENDRSREIVESRGRKLWSAK